MLSFSIFSQILSQVPVWKVPNPKKPVFFLHCMLSREPSQVCGLIDGPTSSSGWDMLGLGNPSENCERHGVDRGLGDIPDLKGHRSIQKASEVPHGGFEKSLHVPTMIEQSS